jgi:hypothetical protein
MKPKLFDKLADKYLSLIEQQMANDKPVKKSFSEEEAKKVGDQIGVDWNKHSLKNFTIGMNVELEHGLKNPKTNVTDDCPFKTGKIALVHMEEVPGTGKGDDYYTLLKKYVESEE